jgi:hypothetical protein
MFDITCNSCKSALVILVLVLSLFVTGLINAQTVVVRVDGISGSANPSSQGDAWGADHAYLHLQDGLARAANLLEGQDPPDQVQIWVRGSSTGITYRPDEDSDHPTGTNPPDAAARAKSFVLRNNVGICAGFDTEETGTEPQQFMQRRPYENICILSGELANDDDPQDPFDPDLIDENSHHILRAIRVNASAIIDGFVVKSGNALDDASDADPDTSQEVDGNQGAGMILIGASGNLGVGCNPTVLRCRFEHTPERRPSSI